MLTQTMHAYSPDQLAYGVCRWYWVHVCVCIIEPTFSERLLRGYEGGAWSVLESSSTSHHQHPADVWCVHCWRYDSPRDTNSVQAIALVSLLHGRTRLVPMWHTVRMTWFLILDRRPSLPLCNTLLQYVNVTKTESHPGTDGKEKFARRPSVLIDIHIGRVVFQQWHSRPTHFPD